MLEITGTIKPGQNNQILDKLKVEQERGITVKAQTCSMIYNHEGTKYLLNLIDTPGHVDFSYEVSRSLAACQGCLLLIDACQGIQAQTIANFYLAFGEGLKILPVINKIDLPSANPDKVISQISKTFELDTGDVSLISAKSGLGVEKLFKYIVTSIPAPIDGKKKDFRALLFDTWYFICANKRYDKYVGVVCLIAVRDGSVKKGDKIVSAHTNQNYEVNSCGIMFPEMTPVESLSSGQVGYITMNMKTTKDAHIGDTFNHIGKRTEVFEGFHQAQSMVFAGLYPVDSNDFVMLSDSIDRLTLNDSSVTVQKETSSSLGQGFRLGFLGTLHMDVFRQRLEEEHGASVINTAPTVPYLIRYKDGTEVKIRSQNDFPESSEFMNVDAFLEPVVRGTLVFPHEYLGKIIQLCNHHRGEQLDISYMDDERVMMKYKLPQSEILTQFYDSLKSASSGYATFDYEEYGYEEADLVKINVLLNSKPVDALSCIVHRNQALSTAKLWVHKLKNVIDRYSCP